MILGICKDSENAHVYDRSEKDVVVRGGAAHGLSKALAASPIERYAFFLLASLSAFP
jgi:hypothetical protein